MNFGRFWAPLFLMFHCQERWQIKKIKGKRKKEKKKQETKQQGVGQTKKSVFFVENIAGRRQATFSQKHGLCLSRFQGLVRF